jgi:hypothetical protein
LRREAFVFEKSLVERDVQIPIIGIGRAEGNGKSLLRTDCPDAENDSADKDTNNQATRVHESAHVLILVKLLPDQIGDPPNVTLELRRVLDRNIARPCDSNVNDFL